MVESNKKTSSFETITITLIFVALLLSIVPPLITPHFVNVDSYINNSKTVEINNIIYTAREVIDIGASQNRISYTIKADNIYYRLDFYRKGTNESSLIQLSKGKVYERLFIRLNEVELDKHKGSIEDPIPVYNYGLTPYNFVWGAEKYEYNIRTHRVFEELLHTKSYEGILLFIIVIGIIPSMYFHFKPSPEAINRAKFKESKKQRSKDRMIK